MQNLFSKSSHRHHLLASICLGVRRPRPHTQPPPPQLGIYRQQHISSHVYSLLCVLNSEEVVLFRSDPDSLTHSHHTAAGGCCFQVIRTAANIAAVTLLSHLCSSLSCHLSKMSGFGLGHMGSDVARTADERKGHVPISSLAT